MGGAQRYARGISFTGFTVTQTRTTFLEIYEAPSGGDWSVHRGAAVFVQDAEAVTFAGLAVDQPGGNGILFSNHVASSSVADSSFRRCGDSAIVSLGKTEAIDGGKPTYPNGNNFLRNSAIDVGVFGKQTSAYAHMLSANATVADNVFLNGPRASININDGFGGGSSIVGNVAANASCSAAKEQAIRQRPNRALTWHRWLPSCAP